VSEPVTITPQTGGLDANDDPLPTGAPGGPVTVRGHVAPGNTTLSAGADATLDAVDFTIYLPLRVRQPGGWVRTIALCGKNFTVTVRGQLCTGRAREWDLGAGRGGVEVLASARTGATP